MSNKVKSVKNVFDRQSVVSMANSTASQAVADRKSIAPSIVMHDFNGKKAKIIQTLKQIDDLKSGVVKTAVFKNLLSCLDVELDEAAFEEC